MFQFAADGLVAWPSTASTRQSRGCPACRPGAAISPSGVGRLLPSRSVPRAAAAAFGFLALFQKDATEMGEHVSHQLALRVLGCKQDQIGEAFRDHGGKLSKVDRLAFEALLHEVVDLAMEAF